MFGASAGVRDAGHIGLDSVVMMLPKRAQFWFEVIVFLLTILFALALLAGGIEMASSTRETTIPTLGVSEAIRYIPIMLAGVLMQVGGLGVPLVFAGATKLTYDFLLWREFRRVKPPEEAEARAA